MMNAWERYWFGSVAAIRPYLLMKTVLCVLAFDVWLLRIQRGGYYGTDGFNVAHFRWLDAVQPLPSPGLYVGLLLSVGILALACAFAGAGRWPLALLALMYTYSWAMSLIDGYQHHYLLSWVLTAFVFFPRVRASDLYPPDVAAAARATKGDGVSQVDNQMVSAWGYVLLGVNLAIVYAFAALSKFDVEWRTGLVLGRTKQVKEVLLPIEVWLAGLGVSGDVFWGLLSLGAIAGEIFIAVGYLLAVRLDENRSRWYRIVTWVAFGIAVSFHLALESLPKLRIGWFSYFMILLACVYFLPASFLRTLGSLVTWPVTGLARIWSVRSAALDRRTGTLTIGLTIIGAAAVAIVVGAVGFALDLPGSVRVGVLVAFALVSATLLVCALGRQQGMLRYVVATGLSAALMWTAVTRSTVRYHYYRLAGATMALRGDLKAALQDFEKATRYAPAGQREKLQQGVDALRRHLHRSADSVGPESQLLKDLTTGEVP